MRFLVISLVLYVFTLEAVADISYVTATKANIISRLLKGKHHKRGILSSIPTYKVGHDIPHVTHSLVKPVVVNYPPTATVSAVKIPLSHPHLSHVPVGHKVHGLPHPHFGLKFPHGKFYKSDQHFHHHHHHVAPTPVVPLPAPVPIEPVVPVTPTVHAAPLIPVAQPTAVAHSVHIPAPASLSAPLIPAHPLPLPAPHLFLQNNLKPLLPAAAVAIPQAPVLPAPVIPFSQRIPYVIRPGSAVQTSVFATYPRYPVFNGFQSPFIPLPPAQGISSIQQVLYERPQVPQLNIFPQTIAEQGLLEHHTPNVEVDQTPLLLPNQIAAQPEVHLHSTQLVPQSDSHLHPTQLIPQPELHVHPTLETVPQTHLHPTVPQPTAHLQPTHSVPLDHDGWSPVSAQPHDSIQPGAHYPQQNFQYTQEQGTQIYEHHTDTQFPDLHQLQHHIQQQIEQAQYEQSLNNQHHIQQEYGAPHQEYGQPNDYHQAGQDFALHHDYHQQGQDFPHQNQGFPQNELGNHGQEYGVPHQGIEGRSEEENQQFHNHIPLALQPPLDRPLDHF